MLDFINNLTNKLRNIPIIKKNPVLKQLIKYSIVGNISNIIDFALYLYLTRIFSFWHENYLIANIFTMFIASVFRFAWHKKWTFRDNGKKVGVQYVKFIIILILSLLADEVILYLFVEYFNVNDILSKLIALLLTTFFVFYGNKKLVFSGNDKRTGQDFII